MYEAKFKAFFDESVPMLTTQENIRIFKNKVAQLDAKYRDDILIHSTFFGLMIKAFNTYKVSSNVMMHLITDWDNIYEIEDLIIKILTNFSCSPDDMKYVICTIDTPDYDDIIEYIIQQDDNMLFSVMYENVNHCFSKQMTQSLLEKQMTIADMYEKEIILTYLTMKQKQFDLYKPKPNYVSFKTGESKSMLQTINQGDDQTMPNKRDDLTSLSDKYIKSLSVNKTENKKQDFDIDRAINIFMATKAQATTPEDQVHVNLKNRLWGPMNAIPNTNCFFNTNSIGPCRMLQCDCREEEGETWFNGTCNACEVKIRNKSYAVRFPLKQGGWIGCFCSFNCMDTAPPVDRGEEEEILIAQTKETLLQDGIFDRLG